MVPPSGAGVPWRRLGVSYLWKTGWGLRPGSAGPPSWGRSLHSVVFVLHITEAYPYSVKGTQDLKMEERRW